MKAIQWTGHALENAHDRAISKKEVEEALRNPDLVDSGRTPRRVYTKRYFDTILEQEMLLRVVIEDTMEAVLVVTMYKTSKINKYLKKRDVL